MTLKNGKGEVVSTVDLSSKLVESLSMNGNALELKDAGGTVTADLSAFRAVQTIQASVSFRGNNGRAQAIVVYGSSGIGSAGVMALADSKAVSIGIVLNEPLDESTGEAIQFNIKINGVVH